ncbi:MAG: sulfatase-like hydrolase/transferase [Bacteroidota bacterium]
MNKILIILLITLVACINQDSKSVSSISDKPNIIFILVDDLGKEWISCYGADSIQTPNIDALAEGGVLFNNFYVMPQCTPTRVSFLTGQYPFRHGWINHWDVPRWGGGAHFDENLNPSIGIEMKKAGYKTCIAGKWQIDDFRVEPDALTKNGFDEYCMWTGGEGNNPPSNERYHNPYIFTSDSSKTYEGKFGPDIFKDFIINFIHKNKQSSFFIYYPMVLTHTPLVNTPDEILDTKHGKHKAMVRYTDKITGEIIKTLDEAEIRDNTIVIWTTDNGTTRGIEGSLNGVAVEGGKAQTTESGICVPFIISWAGQLDEGQKSDALIDITDMYPTFLEFAGADLKLALNDKLIDGHSFKNILVNNSSKSNRKWILGMGGQNNARLTENGVENQFIFRDRVLRNKRFKLYVDTKKQPDKFYDLEEDPFEKNNIIDSLNTPERKDNLKGLTDLISSFPGKDNDPVYHPNPPREWDVKITAESQDWKK